ncbi:mucolipin-2 [Scleropages formosus]|uniref:Mucolipin TRP cation channel 2 n=1 Tax=Scleropages formosus TaxID=113540 RepID=A0A8C9S4Q6_SCLFO|nr:mucolipin-2 [Scleropages formosus]
MEFLVRYNEASDSIRTTISPNNVPEEEEEEEMLRNDLKYYFMSPCEKYRARRQIPWKLGVQILKIIMITTQLVIFGLNNQIVVSYKEENAMAFKRLFLKGYGGVDEDDYSIAWYTQQDVHDGLFYLLDQYGNLRNLSVGPVSYAQEDSESLPIVICKELYKKGSKPFEEYYNIEVQTETVCITMNPISLQDDKWKRDNGSFFAVDFYRFINMKITFQLKGVNLHTIRAHELPDCYTFFVTIYLDNQGHSGLIKVYFEMNTVSSACKNWKISGTAQRNTHYVLIFDSFVILICLTSAVLCTRSMILAIKLLQRFSRFFRVNYKRKICKADQKEFLNGWYVMVIISDVLAIIGSILKMEIQSKNLTSYAVCSIFLGTSTLLAWVGVIRYLGYFQTYNVLILTMQAAFPKVLRFCCCAGMIYLGYTFCGWIVLGPYHEKFEGLSRVAECLFSLVNGDDMFPTFAQFHEKSILVWLFSRVYLYSFISLFIYMVLSLFIALITDSYETIKNYQKNGFPMTDLQKFLREQRDFTCSEGSRQVESNYWALCCCRRLPNDDDILLIC